MWRSGASAAAGARVLERGTAALLAQSPGLRGATPLLEAFDLAHILHHGLSAEEGEGELPEIAEQWTRAMAWLFAPARTWGEADRLL